MNCKVKRYDPINSDGTCGMCVEDADYGAYVEFADYAALAAELSALKAQQELDELRRACAEILGQDPETWPSHGNAPLAIASALALAVSTAPQPAPAQPAVHPDDAAVDRFAAAMKAKLAKAREKGRGGWDDKAQCSQQYLSDLLRGHVDKGDPVDVANFCMMLSLRGEGIAAPRQPEGEGLEVVAYVDSGGALYTAKLLEIMAVDSAGCDPLCRLSDHQRAIAELRGECERLNDDLQWAVDRWHAEVSQRPLVNVHRRSLDDTWRQIIRRLGGDDVLLCGPRHDDLVSGQPLPPAPEL
jgi:hypothetical protein